MKNVGGAVAESYGRYYEDFEIGDIYGTSTRPDNLRN